MSSSWHQRQAKTKEHTDPTFQQGCTPALEKHEDPFPPSGFHPFLFFWDLVLTTKDPVLKLYPGLWRCIPKSQHTGGWKILRPAWTTLCDPISTTTTAIIIAHCCYSSAGCDDAHLISALRSQKLKNPESVSCLATQGIQKVILGYMGPCLRNNNMNVNNNNNNNKYFL